MRQLSWRWGAGVKGPAGAWTAQIARAMRKVPRQPDPLTPARMKVVASHHGLRAVALLRHLVASCLPAMVGAVLISLSPALVLDYAGGRLAPVAHLSPGLSSSQGTPGRLPKRTVDDRGHAAAFEALSPAGAKTSPVVSMCQIASARRRARSTRATFFPRWRPRRRAMYW